MDSRELQKLAQAMKEDWNRRVRHDYRFWMSDGYRDDAAMWQSGERDLNILVEGISDLKSKTFLDLGCGVGRLLRSATERFGKVVALDVSEQAIGKAREFLGANPNLQLLVGNGLDLHPIEDASVDVVGSFAALTSMPTDIVAGYLREMHRVLIPGGLARIQLYLGSEQEVSSDDTLHLRCFQKENFLSAVRAAGFEVQSISELVLPFKVSFKEIGIEAVVVSLRKLSALPASAVELSHILLPQGEQPSASSGNASQDLEAWMVLHYAKDLAERGATDEARRSLRYVEQHCATTTLDIRDLLQQIVGTIEQKERTSTHASESLAPRSAEFYEANLKILAERFPDVYQRLLSGDRLNLSGNEVEIKGTAQGPVVFSHGLCLDHPDKPKTSADMWARKLLQEKRIQNCSHIVVFGMGCGYHIEALRSLTAQNISIIEPDENSFRLALGCRDLMGVLTSISKLCVGHYAVPDWFSSDTELSIRPQTQAGAAQFCTEVRSALYGARGLSVLHPRIGVLGPIQGGTLPIMGYTGRALIELKQSVRLFDMSGFSKGLHLVDEFVRDDIRKSCMQMNYVEMLSQLLLESVTEKPIDILICMAQAPISNRALEELRKRGVITVLWFVEDYLRFHYWRGAAHLYDFVFTIQKGKCLEAIKRAGAGEVHYLPTACDPAVHAPLVTSAEERMRWGSLISFVGAGYHNRQQMFAGLSTMPFKIWGTEWPTCKPFDRMVQEQGRRLTPDEYVKIFNASDINLNLHSSTERDGVDPNGDFLCPRTFELAACEAFQLVDYREYLSEAFEIGKEVCVFKNTQELIEKIQYYTAHPDERRAMAKLARAKALKEHTYTQRLRSMLSTIYSSKFEYLRQREQNAPWTKMLQRAESHPELFKRCRSAFERGEEPNLDGLVSDIINGKGKLSETEQKLLFLFHVRKQIIRMKQEEGEGKFR